MTITLTFEMSSDEITGLAAATERYNAQQAKMPDGWVAIDTKTFFQQQVQGRLLDRWATEASDAALDALVTRVKKDPAGVDAYLSAKSLAEPGPAIIVPDTL